MKAIRWRLIAGWTLGAWIVVTGGSLPEPKYAAVCDPMQPETCAPRYDPCLTRQEGKLWTCEGWKEELSQR